MSKDTSAWELIDEDFDLRVEAGDFIGVPGDYEIMGETIKSATNWLNALHRWLWQGLERNGNEREHCSHCGRRIRYAAIYRDATGLHIAGMDCAELINARKDAGFNRQAFYDAKNLRKIRRECQIASNGNTYYSMECPPWFWDIAKSRRPAFTRIRKWDRNNTWYLTIWGESVDEIAANYEVLIALRGTPNTDDGTAFVGTLNERGTFNLTVESFYETSGIYGDEYSYTFSDADGNKLVYKGTSNLGVTKGQVIKLAATVKAHKERNGEKSTWLNRPKLQA